MFAICNAYKYKDDFEDIVFNGYNSMKTLNDMKQFADDYESDNFMHWDNLEQIEALTGTNVVATISKNASDIMLLEGLFKE